MSTPVDKAGDPNYLKADKYDSLDKDSGLRANVEKISISLPGTLQKYPNTEMTIGNTLPKATIDEIMELVQQSNVEVAEQATEALLFNGNTVYWKGKGYNITLKEEQHG